MTTFPLEVPAIKVTQPLGEFYITKFRASEILQVSFSEELTYIDSNGKLRGIQRKKDKKRLDEIARYIDSVEMAFPNSIILAANYVEELGEPISSDDKSNDLDSDTSDNNKISEIAWRLVQVDEDIYKIIIPTAAHLASIIDGQHRLMAFDSIDKSERLDVELPCAVFFDLPNTYQAFLFATINGNQKKVDRSLALEQFGFNVEEEPSKSWNPEKLAVFFSRRLNIRVDSPFHQHIKVAPNNQRILFKYQQTGQWTVSTATIVDGILSLISSKPKRDRVEMAQESLFGRSRKMISSFSDSAPLRPLYLENQDEEIYLIVYNFFCQVKELLWDKAPEDSYIVKTVGILASFDLLKRILQTDSKTRDFRPYLQGASGEEFTDDFFQASGVGRSRIRNYLYRTAKLNRPAEKMSGAASQSMERLLAKRHYT